MAKVQKISGFDEFKAKIQEINATATELVVYFSGSKTRSGRSWCPDCNDAEPFVNQYGIKNATSDRTFVIVDVGDRVTWKDMKNPFRLDKDTHLSVIPTLINWKEKAQRLEGDQLCKPELLEMFFEED